MKFSLIFLILFITCHLGDQSQKEVKKITPSNLPKSNKNSCSLKNKTAFKNGGEKGMLEFIFKHFKYPNIQTYETKIILSFEVNENGKVVNPIALNDVSIELKKEAIRVVKLMEFSPYDAKDGYCNVFIPLRIELE